VKLFFVVDLIPKKIGSDKNRNYSMDWHAIRRQTLEKIGSVVALKITSADPVG
jgi:hypothetical protein